MKINKEKLPISVVTIINFTIFYVLNIYALMFEFIISLLILGTILNALCIIYLIMKRLRLKLNYSNYFFPIFVFILAANFFKLIGLPILENILLDSLLFMNVFTLLILYSFISLSAVLPR